jgi:hypothetical protein
MNESHFEMGDEYDGDDTTSEDCSDEFEQGLLETLDDYGQAKVFSHFLDRLLK